MESLHNDIPVVVLATAAALEEVKLPLLHVLNGDSISQAVIIFVDIRGFTRWSSHTEVSRHLGKFLRGFYVTLKEAFPKAFMKPLGDGAMIVELIHVPDSVEDTMALCQEILGKIRIVSDHFNKECESFSLRLGHIAILNLGWGISRGMVNLINDPLDYVGMNVNLASRLCGLARPAGIVFDREDFTVVPEDDADYAFRKAEHTVKGIDEVISLWVSESVDLTLAG